METNAATPVIKTLESTDTISTVDELQEPREMLNAATDNNPKIGMKQSPFIHSGELFYFNFNCKKNLDQIGY